MRLTEATDWCRQNNAVLYLSLNEIKVSLQPGCGISPKWYKADTIEEAVERAIAGEFRIHNRDKTKE